MTDSASQTGDGADSPRIVPVGDSAVLIEFGSGITVDLNTQVYSLADRIDSIANPAVTELVPTYRSLLVHYNPLEARYGEMVKLLSELIASSGDTGMSETTVAQNVVELPVVYGGEDGPDLGFVAEHAELSPEEVVAIHSGVGYRVYMIGFAPGFPYLGGLDERIACPRLKTPRISVPAGSVGIAEAQTGVYPNASPGGWQIIGRTAIPLFDVKKASPSLITPGAEVRFVPVDSHD
ncbi:MAG: 5-oxoprolinase subunit PxpB [Chloroflexi bacterium]|nr:5-oxoprolinase subunit PxpB [Chloroflexota bacterium]